MTRQELVEKITAFQVGFLNEVKRTYSTPDVVAQVDIIRAELFQLCMLIRAECKEAP